MKLDDMLTFDAERDLHGGGDADNSGPGAGYEPTSAGWCRRGVLQTVPASPTARLDDRDVGAEDPRGGAGRTNDSLSAFIDPRRVMLGVTLNLGR
jgi:hypothetical protein